MRRRARIILFSSLGLVIGIAAVGFWLVWRHTAFLRPAPSPAAIEENNKTSPANQNTLPPEAPFVLEPQELSVTPEQRRGAFTQTRVLNVPTSTTVTVFATGLSQPRFFSFDETGALLVADKGAGTVVRLVDTNADGKADQQKTVLDGLRTVHSVAWHKGDLFVAEEHQVSVLRGIGSDGSFTSRQVVISSLPSGAGHSTRTVMVGPDEKLYVSVGSSCNLCEEKNERRAAVLRADLDGSNLEIFSSGLRNSVGLTRHGTEIWAVDNGRDLLGDDLPPEELNKLELGAHYGWPYCYGKGVPNPEYASRAGYCANETRSPVVEMQAHSAPLGVTAIPGTGPLGRFEDQFVIAFHGSWNRTVRTGYKVVVADARNPNQSVQNVVTGWLDASGKVWGRPVGVGFGPDSALYISDDEAGALYRVASR